MSTPLKFRQAIQLPGSPVGELEAATKGYVDGLISTHTHVEYALSSRTITAGNGLTGGGSLTANRTISLGTPSAVTPLSTNSSTTSSHSHSFTTVYSGQAASALPSTYPAAKVTNGYFINGIGNQPMTHLTASDLDNNAVAQLAFEQVGGTGAAQLHYRTWHPTSNGGGWTSFQKVAHDSDLRPLYDRGLATYLTTTDANTIGSVHGPGISHFGGTVGTPGSPNSTDIFNFLTLARTTTTWSQLAVRSSTALGSADVWVRMSNGGNTSAWTKLANLTDVQRSLPLTITDSTDNASDTTNGHTHKIDFSRTLTGLITSADYAAGVPTISNMVTDGPEAGVTALTFKVDSGNNRICQFVTSPSGGNQVPKFWLRTSHSSNGGGGWTAFQKILLEGDKTELTSRITPKSITVTSTNTGDGTGHTHQLSLLASRTGAQVIADYPNDLVTGGPMVSGGPVANATHLTVRSGSNNVLQLVGQPGGGSTTPALWIRSHHTSLGGGGWTAFVKMATEQDVSRLDGRIDNQMDPYRAVVLSAADVTLTANKHYILTGAGIYTLPTNMVAGDYLTVYAGASLTLETGTLVIRNVGANNDLVMTEGFYIALRCVSPGQLIVVSVSDNNP